MICKPQTLNPKP